MRNRLRTNAISRPTAPSSPATAAPTSITMSISVAPRRNGQRGLPGLDPAVMLCPTGIRRRRPAAAHPGHRSAAPDTIDGDTHTAQTPALPPRRPVRRRRPRVASGFEQRVIDQRRRLLARPVPTSRALPHRRDCSRCSASSRRPPRAATARCSSRPLPGSGELRQAPVAQELCAHPRLVGIRGVGGTSCHASSACAVVCSVPAAAQPCGVGYTRKVLRLPRYWSHLAWSMNGRVNTSLSACAARRPAPQRPRPPPRATPGARSAGLPLDFQQLRPDVGQIYARRACRDGRRNRAPSRTPAVAQRPDPCRPAW